MSNNKDNNGNEVPIGVWQPITTVPWNKEEVWVMRGTSLSANPHRAKISVSTYAEYTEYYTHWMYPIEVPKPLRDEPLPLAEETAKINELELKLQMRTAECDRLIKIVESRDEELKKLRCKLSQFRTTIPKLNEVLKASYNKRKERWLERIRECGEHRAQVKELTTNLEKALAKHAKLRQDLYDALTPYYFPLGVKTIDTSVIKDIFQRNI